MDELTDEEKATLWNWQIPEDELCGSCDGKPAPVPGCVYCLGTGRDQPGWEKRADAEIAELRRPARSLDDVAQDYYLDPPDDVWLEERVQAWIMPRIAQWCVGRTLEMGYGTGLTTRLLSQMGVDIDVVEGSSALVSDALAWRDAVNAAADIPLCRVAVFEARFEEWNPPNLYDTVLCLHVLEHVAQPRELLARVRGWLKPGGRLIVVTPNARSIHRKVGALMSGDMIDTLSERDRLVGHLRVYDLDQLAGDVLASSAFRLTNFGGWFLKPTNNARMIDWPPEHIDALCELGWVGRAEDAANIIVVAQAV